MRTIPLALALTLAASLPTLAEGRGGDRNAAGGAFMSSYAQPPSAAPGNATPVPAWSFGAPDVTATATAPERSVYPRSRAPRR